LKGKSVPDPYWNDSGFEKVFQMLDEATDGLIKQMTS
jgi:protein-tyrosine phosphatase